MQSQSSNDYSFFSGLKNDKYTSVESTCGRNDQISTILLLESCIISRNLDSFPPFPMLFPVSLKRDGVFSAELIEKKDILSEGNKNSSDSSSTLTSSSTLFKFGNITKDTLGFACS